MSNSGKLVISVKMPRKKTFGELTVFAYDNGSRQKSERRYGALDRAASCVAGWASRYHLCRDAAFEVREITSQDGQYSKRAKGKVINVYKELDSEKQSRIAFDLHIAAQRREEEEAAARKRAKQRGEAAPAKPKAARAAKAGTGTPKAKTTAQQRAEAGTPSRRDIRRAAKKACKAAEGNIENWKAYLAA